MAFGYDNTYDDPYANQPDPYAPPPDPAPAPTSTAPTAGTQPYIANPSGATNSLITGFQFPIASSTVQNATGGTVAPPVNGDYQTWFMNLVKGMPSSPDQLAALAPQLAAYGIQVHNNLSGEATKIILPDGSYVSPLDVNGQWRWVNQGTPGQNSSPTPGTINGSSLINPNDPYYAQIRQSFLDALKTSSTPYTADSPEIAPSIAASRTGSQRALDQTRNAIAERAYATGNLNTAGFDQQQQQAVEGFGQNESQTEAGLVSQFNQQRMQMLAALLGQGGNQVNNQNSLALQEELAGGQLGYQYSALQAEMNRQALLAALGA